MLDLGSRLELFADNTLIESLSGGAQLRLQHPIPRETAITCDAPWEGNGCGYITVFRDGDRYRMYYRGGNYRINAHEYTEAHRCVYCYAESADGITWAKPKLGLVEFDGTKDNNIILDGIGQHSFAPFKDTNPVCAPEARYKAIANGGGADGVYSMQSPDAIHWSLMADKPVMTEGAFDSQNLAFWDAVRGEYRAYFRDFRDGRDIKTCTSRDFLNWTPAAWLDYTPGRTSELYTNQVAPYYRAPHIFLGFPTRYLDRGWTESHNHLPRVEWRRIRSGASPREGTAITDGMFMVSHDGQHFSIWPESFIRPGLRTTDNWFYGDNYQAWGLVETASVLPDGPAEISLYANERYHQDVPTVIRRFTLRVDGFASVQAPLSGGEVVTKLLTFAGSELVLNLSTSAAGGVRVQIEDANGMAAEGYLLADCNEVFGDGLARVVSWKGGSDLSAFAGKVVRLRIELKDADVYSLRFR